MKSYVHAKRHTDRVRVRVRVRVKVRVRARVRVDYMPRVLWILHFKPE